MQEGLEIYMHTLLHQYNQYFYGLLFLFEESAHFSIPSTLRTVHTERQPMSLDADVQIGHGDAVLLTLGLNTVHGQNKVDALN